MTLKFAKQIDVIIEMFSKELDDSVEASFVISLNIA